MNWKSEHLEKWQSIFDTCSHCPATSLHKGIVLPSKHHIIQVLNKIIGLLFPGCLGHDNYILPEVNGDVSNHRPSTEEIADDLYSCILPVYKYYCTNRVCENKQDCERATEKAIIDFFSKGDELRETLKKDIIAAYEGDPAAKSQLEVVMSYPGLYATLVHRIAHLLFKLEVPLIPRVMSEYAHSHTGIDIHPGATIGEGFFIDHGTGVVIGETCVIGKNVKLYQGVTLGALSFAKDDSGNLIKGIKRHPNVEDNVIIYAGATILGGETTIGHDSVIGGNVWLIHSVPPYSKVYNSQPNPTVKTQE